MTKKELIAALNDKGVQVKNVSKVKVAELEQILKDASKPAKVKKVKALMTNADPKYNMYFIALPKAIRDTVIKKNLDPRALYNEYRKRGREHMIATYAN
uniref:hypothetical protein n=1 Tax=Nitrospira cf. moscoviensis SBR1015 TaxID=96242 RepID=UPI001122F945|nr:hypothetical protein [Nitrospira cf. moscoviensis SBR1015]